MLLVHDAKEGDESIRTGVLFRGVGEKSSRPKCYQHSVGRALAGCQSRSSIKLLGCVVTLKKCQDCTYLACLRGIERTPDGRLPNHL